jgi:hypothetical protein
MRILVTVHNTGFGDSPQPRFYGKPEEICTLVENQRRNEERSEVLQQWFSKICHTN